MHRTQEENITQKDYSERLLDPNVAQRQASTPDAHAWVSASAGTGKTKVLTDRILRLLLPRENGTPGTPIHKILCLTFTKAAAREMIIRLNETLRRWAIIEDDALKKELDEITQRNTDDRDLKAAKHLFSRVSDDFSGVKIMTVHAFCQSILGRFPLEARVPTYFTVIEDQEARTLLEQAKNNTLKNIRKPGYTPIHTAFKEITQIINEDQFMALLKDITSEWSQFSQLINTRFGVEGLYETLCATLEIPANQSISKILLESCEELQNQEDELKECAKYMVQNGSKKEKKSGADILDFLTLSATDRMVHYRRIYEPIFITQSGNPRKMTYKATNTARPDIADTLLKEGQRIFDLYSTITHITCAQQTKNILTLCKSIGEQYNIIKTNRSVLDYSDLILKTVELLYDKKNTMRTAFWVMHKLDQGIDHILIDEAQDTNPEQWKIVEALCDEFFSGDGAHSDPDKGSRTLFVVGDEKQSIYSFQRASPEAFTSMRHDLRSKANAAEKTTWRDVLLNISFRSTHTVLQAVDSVFSNENMHEGLSQNSIQHHSHRTGQGGQVTLWPLFSNIDDAEEEPDFWAPPINVHNEISSSTSMAQHIAKTIKNWLDNQEILASRERPIQPNDILILVRSRNQFSKILPKTLLQHGIPVSGTDRLKLNQQLAVHDILALLEFCLAPYDDLNLACILKSPLIKLSEDDLYNLSADRKETLWNTLKASSHHIIVNYLSELITRGQELLPFDFLSYIMHTPCPADTQSGLRAIKTQMGQDIVDVLHELLSEASLYERTDTPTLLGFIYNQRQSEKDIKREMDSNDGAVRIMTVHGAKGLQAPIVIMPDTAHYSVKGLSSSDKRLLWPDKTGLSTPIWSPNKETDIPLYKECMQKLDQRLEDEYKRLLYVAMTRAEDRLYIGGFTGKKTAHPRCWYNLIHNGLKAIEEIETDDQGALHLSHKQTREGDRLSTVHEPKTHPLPLPEWATIPPIQEAQHIEDRQNPVQNIAPEEQTEEQKMKAHKRRMRGTIIHKVFEILPGTAQEKQKNVIEKYLNRYVEYFKKESIEATVLSILITLNDPKLHHVFSKDGLSEVPVYGTNRHGNTIHGQIDRLVVTEKDVHIVDFKTGQRPKNNTAPDTYQKQMENYADVLRHIYPDHDIHASLIWLGDACVTPVHI